jgi:N-formylglutamate amidohydrolase
MKKHPVVIVAPHSSDHIPQAFRERINLSDFELWQMHDPFTSETCSYPEAYSVHRAKNHRLLGDLNRDRNAEDIFKGNDFYGRKIWKDDKGLVAQEKEELLKEFWDPFRNSIRESFSEMKKAGFKKILFIDHHNTATDHPANHGLYLPPINLGNYGDSEGNLNEVSLSASPEIMKAFQASLLAELPELTIEMNTVYKGSSLVRFIRDEIQPEFPNFEIHSILLEYNLNFIFNPLSKKVDEDAKNKLVEGVNKSIHSLVENYFL